MRPSEGVDIVTDLDALADAITAELDIPAEQVAAVADEGQPLDRADAEVVPSLSRRFRLRLAAALVTVAASWCAWHGAGELWGQFTR